MAQKLPGSKYKTNADKGIDIVKNLISIEVDNTIKILVPNFPFETNFYDTKDWHVEGYLTQAIKDIKEPQKKELIRASKLRWIRNFLIFQQNELEESAEDTLVKSNYDYLDLDEFNDRLQSLEHKDWKRYFEFKDTFCIHNHTENKKCNNSLFPCRACLIKDKMTFPLFKPSSRVLRIN